MAHECHEPRHEAVNAACAGVVEFLRGAVENHMAGGNIAVNDSEIVRTLSLAIIAIRLDDIARKMK